MKFGVREICDVVFRAKSYMKLGNREYFRDDPVIYFDTLTASSLEGAATSVYAKGGRGYARLIAWEGERTMTFNMTDALLSPESFAVLSGAGLVEASEQKPIYVHTTSQVKISEANTITLNEVAMQNTHSDVANYLDRAGIYIMLLNDAGEVVSEPCVPAKDTGSISYETAGKTVIKCNHAHRSDGKTGLVVGDIVLVDYYVKKTQAQMLEIKQDSFGGYFYVEASTLFRRESDGKDLPAEFIIPKAKVQSNFTFSMAPTGDPSTFDFVLDAFPDYPKFDFDDEDRHKIFAAIQIINVDADAEKSREACKLSD